MAVVCAIDAAHSGTGGHITRMRVALGEGSFTALQADGSGSLILFAGILLLIPGFITDIVALHVLVGPLRRALGLALGSAVSPVRDDGVVNLAPEQWHQVPGHRYQIGADTNASAEGRTILKKNARGLAPKIVTDIPEKTMHTQIDSVLVPPSTLC